MGHFVTRILCDGGTKLGPNENNSSHKYDTKYIHVATTKLQQVMSQTVKCLER